MSTRDVVQWHRSADHPRFGDERLRPDEQVPPQRLPPAAHRVARPQGHPRRWAKVQQTQRGDPGAPAQARDRGEARDARG